MLLLPAGLGPPCACPAVGAPEEVEMECILCGSEVNYLEVVKPALEWNGDEWVIDDKAVSVIQCPECGDELDTGDLALMRIPSDIIQRLM